MKIMILASGSVRSNFTYRVLQLACALQKKGHQISLVVPSADKYNNFIQEKITNIDGVTIHQPFQFRTKNIVLNLFPYLIGAAVRVLREKPDCIYIYKPTPITIIGFIGKLFRRSQVILDMDDLGSEVMKIEGHPWYQQKLVAFSERFAALHADRIVVASTFLLDLYQTRYPSKPIYFMPNGVDSAWFSDIQNSDPLPRIVFMGAMNRKSILDPLFDVLPAVMQKCPSVSVLIIGDGSCVTYFKERVSKEGLENVVTFTGWLTLDEIKEKLRVGDIGYNYMPYERTVLAASNMKVPQYMARGVVPIVSALGDLPRTIDNGDAGYIANVDSLPDLEKKLVEALSDNTRTEKARYAQQYAKNNFSWDVLAEKFEAFLFNRKNAKKRIYIVATSLPGNVGGAEIRNLNMIQQLKKLDAAIEIFCVDSSNKTNAEVMAAIGVPVHVVPQARGSLSVYVASIMRRTFPFMEKYRSSDLEKALKNRCMEEMPTVVQVEQLTSYYSIRKLIPWLRQYGVKIVYDSHNVEAVLMESSLVLFPLLKRIGGRLLLPKLQKLEREAVMNCDEVFACSTIDADSFRQLTPRVSIIPNGVDTALYAPQERIQTMQLLFMGGVAYPPNADGLLFYAQEIHPLVTKEIPEASLTVIGATNEWLARRGIKDTSIRPQGFVDSIDSYLATSAIGICPVRYGSGTRLKVLTYMAAGLPVISTEKGAEGIMYDKQKNIAIADNPKAFANEVVALLKNPALYTDMATDARKLVVEHYDWNVIGNVIRNIYENI